MILNRGDFLKKILKLNLGILIIIMLLFLLTGCSSDEDKQSIQQKVNSEISYFDSELTSIANQLNNINYTKYKVEVQEMKDTSNQSESSQGDSSSSNQEGGSSQGEQKQSENSQGEQQQSSTENNQEGSKGSSSSNKSFSMESSNILGKQIEVNWDILKSKIENVYSTWTIVSLDLKEIGVSSEDINNFSDNMDKLAVAIKNEDNISVLDNVINLYGFLPKFIEIYGTDKEKNVIDSKYNLLMCYKYATLEDWEQLQNSVNNLKMSFSNVSNKKDEYIGRKINIESAAVIIKEMENSLQVEDKDVFFIKYKNLMKEIDIILSV